MPMESRTCWRWDIAMSVKHMYTFLFRSSKGQGVGRRGVTPDELVERTSTAPFVWPAAGAREFPWTSRETTIHS